VITPGEFPWSLTEKAPRFMSTITTGDFTSGQLTFISRLAADTGLDVRVVATWVYLEENGSAAQARQSANNNCWLNVGYTDSGTYGNTDSIWGNPATAANATAGWLDGRHTIPGYGAASTGIQNILQTAGQSPAIQIRAIQTSGWASSGYPDFPSVFKELAGDFADGLSGTAASGGVYGLGGTGTPGNQTAISLWVNGDSSNPDQDYWTTINQYCQDAQWYCFSDGETLFIADGFKLLAQTPQAVIVRTDPSVLSAQLVYDNTTFTGTHTHVMPGSNYIKRRATLPKVQTPTQCQVTLICDPDAFRGGDTVYLKLFGPADGIWLVGDCTRSYFSPSSTLTLVQGMAPLNANTGTDLGPAYETGPAASKPGSGKVIGALISEATTINNKQLPYELGGGHAVVGNPSPATVSSSDNEGPPGTIGFDCSAAVAAVLAAGGLWPQGSSVPNDAGVVQQLLGNGILKNGTGSGRPECTIYDAPGYHIFMRLNGQVFGTADGGGTPTANGGGGGAWLTSGPDQTSQLV
jgi:hypothetical protein